MLSVRGSSARARACVRASTCANVRARVRAGPLRASLHAIEHACIRVRGSSKRASELASVRVREGGDLFPIVINLGPDSRRRPSSQCELWRKGRLCRRGSLSTARSEC